MADEPPTDEISDAPQPTETNTTVITDKDDSVNLIVRHKLDLQGVGVRPLVGLELPLYGSDMCKVLETVNGLSSLQMAHETKSQFLPVKLRPSEPSCKPLFADLTKTQMILLRVTRSRPKRRRKAPSKQIQDAKENSQVVTADGYRIKVTVAGLVKEKYVCEGMADFQYFTARSFYPTLKLDKEANTVVDHATDAVEMAATNRAQVESGPLSMPSRRQKELQNSLRPYLAVKHETQLELIPEVFSKVDLPLKYEFRQRSGYKPTTVAKKTSSTMTYLNFQDDTPAPNEPKPEKPVMRRRSVGVDDHGVDARVIQILQAKLEQKPIWLRSKLFDGLDAVERRAARRLLRKLCYVFVDGPWRGSWIKMGYDPRQPDNSESASRYQVVELRNNRELVHSRVTHASRKRIKKFAGTSTGNANKESGHVKGPRIVKVTQTSAFENAQVAKRRRKERFTRGETRRSYLVEPTKPGSITSAVPTVPTAPRANPKLSPGDSENSMDSDRESNGAPERADDGTTSEATLEKNDKLFEIFGVQLASPNVLFQLDEIDDDEVWEWISQFKRQSTPSLLGGWYPTQMFLPLREIIRLRIAAMVGRSNTELETRRKRLIGLKKQALRDFAEELASRSKAQQNVHASDCKEEVKADENFAEASAIVAEDDDDLDFEQSLLRDQSSELDTAEVSANPGTERHDYEEDDLDEINDNDISAGRT
ncbi:RNA polymerase III transcription factor (TF)IIIC subunit [Plasmopara halstedii]|uniref:RNA polymerase III transcription factor (TF)IIIC subunit n=1 Tax=Plasmopara halstedii TaxID=4781 RepID=A0A0P1AH88_PLAHL|nr:RNA polymerase III transcription factor (TF)IIIC subunit [Plasmopara halstedii]CEG40561.1 RNA polymerase III transcription factor (TF)IIIC subunit [Plasmopara halstedii]|eukprot:XP_024576930.1 RNA polymerase III transcription factor (TF)IIIC subunit [Plasmopara halstedii]